MCPAPCRCACTPLPLQIITCGGVSAAVSHEAQAYTRYSACIASARPATTRPAWPCHQHGGGVQRALPAQARPASGLPAAQLHEVLAAAKTKAVLMSSLCNVSCAPLKECWVALFPARCCRTLRPGVGAAAAAPAQAAPASGSTSLPPRAQVGASSSRLSFYTSFFIPQLCSLMARSPSCLFDHIKGRLQNGTRCP